MALHIAKKHLDVIYLCKQTNKRLVYENIVGVAEYIINIGKVLKEVLEKGKRINTIKRVGALVLAVTLVVLYLSTLYFAITDDVKTMSFFRAAVALTILVPVLLYAYQLVFRVMKSLGDKNDEQK